MSTKQILIQAVLSQIQDDIARIDTKALSELLSNHPDDVALTNYLDDDRLEQYQKDTNTEVEVEEAKESFISNVSGGQMFDTVDLGYFDSKDGEWITMLESIAE